MTTSETVAATYSHVAAAWREGPAVVYDQLANHLVGSLPGVRGATALDLGAGTGAASMALARGGAQVIALDISPGMLALDAERRPPCVVGEAVALPFRDAAFDIVVAAFSLNHLSEPAAGLQEAHRVTRRGGRMVAASYAADDHHPVKDAAAAAAAEFGWVPQPWMEAVRQHAMPLLATVERARGQLRLAGLHGRADHVQIELGGLSDAALVEWRLGMADVAPFVATLGQPRRASLRARAVQLMGAAPPLVRSIIVITIDA